MDTDYRNIKHKNCISTFYITTEERPICFYQITTSATNLARWHDSISTAAIKFPLCKLFLLTLFYLNESMAQSVFILIFFSFFHFFLRLEETRAFISVNSARSQASLAKCVWCMPDTFSAILWPDSLAAPVAHLGSGVGTIE